MGWNVVLFIAGLTELKERPRAGRSFAGQGDRVLRLRLAGRVFDCRIVLLVLALAIAARTVICSGLHTHAFVGGNNFKILVKG